MKKLNKEQACELLKNGTAVVVVTSSRDQETCKTISDFEKLERLYYYKAIEKFEIFLPDSVKIKGEHMELNMEDAYKLVREGDVVYGVEDGDELKLEDEDELTDYIRKALVKGKPILYWR